MSALGFVFPVGYGLVLLEAAVMCVQCFHEGMSAFNVRQRIFTRSFFSTHFPSIKPEPEMGYPDNGGGRFSDRLSDSDWLEVANAQRAHYNYVEQLPISLSLLTISGLVYPRVAVIGGAVYIVGRALYGQGYRSKGSKGRYRGVVAVDVGLLLLLGGSLMSAWTIGGGWAGTQKALLSFTKW